MCPTDLGLFHTGMLINVMLSIIGTLHVTINQII